jgi:hypothetical protein
MTNNFVAAASLTHSSSSLEPPSMSAATSGASLAAAKIELPQTSSLDVMTAMTKVPDIIHLPNTQQVISLKLSNTNFLYWRMQMKPFLFSQGVFPFVDGSLPCPPSHVISVDTSLPTINASYLSWKQQDYLIMSALLSFLSMEVMHLMVDCNTSHDIWTMLETTLASPSNSRIMQLHGSFQEL